MPCITFPIDPAIGPVVDIGIALPNSLATQGAPPAPIHWVKAIADTGCSHTSVHTSVAAGVGLPIIAQANVQSTTQNAVPANVFLVDIFLRVNSGGSVFEWAFRDRPVLELLRASLTHEALLGMDLMGTGTFNVNGLLKMATFCW
jgi:hypothetical protein